MKASLHSVSTETSSSGPEKPNQHLSITSIPKLYLKLALPIAVGLLLNGLYSVVDAYFIANYVGANGFASVSAVFPFQLFIIAIAVLIGNGVSILLSQLWASERYIQSGKVLGSGLMLIGLVSLTLIICTWAFTPNILATLGVTAQLYADAQDYFKPICYAAILVLSLSLISDVLRAQANMTGLFTIILIGAASNIALDFLFIVILSMGTYGAALATLLGQALGILLGLYLLNISKQTYKLSLSSFGISCSNINAIIKIGLPVFLSYVGASVVMTTVNNLIASHDETNTSVIIAAYGIIGRINIFVILPLIAISTACQTIVAHNYGAKNTLRSSRAGLVGTIIATIYLLMVCGTILTFPEQIAGIFSDNKQVILQTKAISQITFLLMPLAGISVICVAFFQAVGKSKSALVLSTAKIYLILLPLVVAIASNYQTNYLWYAFPIADSLALLLAICAVYLYMSNHFAKQLTGE